MKIRIFTCLLVLMMLVAYLPVWATSDGAVLTVQAPTELPKAGDEFDVTVEISNNPGFCALQFTLTFDKTKLECTRIKTGELMAGMLSALNPNAKEGAVIASATLDTVEDDGLLATFKCKALEDITEWSFGLKSITLQDIDSNDLAYELAGVVEEKEETPGGSLPEEFFPEEDFPEDEVVEDTPSQPQGAGSGGGGVSSGTTGSVDEQPEDNEDETVTEETPTVVEPMFPDTKGHWAVSFINTAAEEGLFKGDDNGNFNPDADVTRAQFVTVLWRMAGAPVVDGETPFVDIQDQIPEFQSAIAWGYSNGYINGISETEFNPDGTLTREAGMKILHFYSGGERGGEQMLASIYDGTFTDSKEISSWAKDSLYWGVYNQLLSGTSETTLSPQGTATRAQLAKILVNYIKSYQ